MMIYLFCNEQYGHLFMQTAIKYVSFYGLDLTIVFSEKDIDYSFKLSHIKTKTKSFIKDLYQKRNYSLIKISNINVPKFYNEILPDSHGIISGFNQIFKEPIIDKFKTLVNFHPSILPLYRGPVPSYWCIENKEKFTGYTLHKVTPKIDNGEFLFQEKISIGNIKDPAILDQKIALFANRCLWEYLDYIVENSYWQNQIINAQDVYETPINYLSFPKK